MSTQGPQVITTKQAKHQVNIFGFPLALYILLNLLLWHGIRILYTYTDIVLFDMDQDILFLMGGIAATLIITFVFFPISAGRLHLHLKDYMKPVKMDLLDRIAYISIGLAITLLTTYTGSLLKFLLHPADNAFAFVGHFTTDANILKNILYIVLFVFLQPISDEYIFRAVIQRQLGHYSRIFGVLASAVLYAIAQPSLSDAIPAFFLGWYLATLTLHFHSIKPALHVHLSISLFLWIISVIPEEYALIPIIVIILNYAATLLFLIGNVVNYKIAFVRFPEKKLWKIVFTSSTIVFCILLFVLANILTFF